MPIGSSGALSLSDIQTEFGGSNPISLSEYYAGGSNVPSGISGDNGAIPSSGAIDISDFYGSAKSVDIALTISGTTQNYNIYANRGGTYVAGISNVVLTVNAIVGSASTGQYAIDTGNQWASGDTLKIINNNQIVGCGGAGGSGAAGQSGQANAAGSNGAAGGSAINLGFDTTIQNNGGFIRGAGGGGGGGSNGSFSTSMKGSSTFQSLSGAGGGGGAGQNGGAGGSAGATMSANGQNVAGNGGQAGSISGAGSGGGAGSVMSSASNGAGGQGGGFGAAGQNGGVGQANTDSGGKSNSASGSGGTGGAAGKAINLGGNSLTWEDGNSNVQGAVS
jgi:hypothetical protein